MTGELIPINDIARKALLGSDESQSDTQAALELICRYETLAMEAMSALVYYYNSDDPQLRSAADAAITRVAETTQAQPPTSPPKPL